MNHNRTLISCPFCDTKIEVAITDHMPIAHRKCFLEYQPKTGTSVDHLRSAINIIRILEECPGMFV